MPATANLRNKILDHLFRNSNYALIGDAAGLLASAVAGSFWISLHTADPGLAGSDAAEATYTSSARVAVARSGGGWTLAADTLSNAAVVTFPKCTGGTNTITHFGIHYDNGAGSMILSGALASSLAVSNNITPSFAIGDLVTTAA